MGVVPRRSPVRVYHLYGLRLRSEWRLPYAEVCASSVADVGLLRGSAARFATAFAEARATADAASHHRGVSLSDGQTYLRWPGRFEFLISVDGATIAARPLLQGSSEAFHTYLLGQALSFALVKQGFDPVHATTVAIDGAAVAFVGESGYGKSSLGATFIRAGDRLLTDDLLVLSPEGGGFAAHAGPPRIKLFPHIARHALGRAVRGTPIASTTRKLVIPLGDRQAFRPSAPLKAIYILTPPSRTRALTGARIRRVSRRHACIALLRNTFNTSVTDPARLSRQLAFAAGVAETVPIKLLAYPRTLRALPIVRAAILADLSRA
jgi:hypothetical protein